MCKTKVGESVGIKTGLDKSSPRIPSSIIVGGLEFSVNMRKPEDAEETCFSKGNCGDPNIGCNVALGCCSFGGAAININPDMSAELQENIFWHEVIEAVFLSHSIDTSHNVLTTIANEVRMIVKQLTED